MTRKQVHGSYISTHCQTLYGVNAIVASTKPLFDKWPRHSKSDHVRMRTMQNHKGVVQNLTSHGDIQSFERPLKVIWNRTMLEWRERKANLNQFKCSHTFTVENCMIAYVFV